MAKKQTKQTKKRKVRIDAVGEAHIGSSFNNIIISLTNNQGQVISWSSAGKMGFRGSKKNTPYAAQMAAEDCGRVALEAGLIFLGLCCRALLKADGKIAVQARCIKITI